MHLHLEIDSVCDEPEDFGKAITLDEFSHKLTPFYGFVGRVKVTVSMNANRAEIPEFGFVNSLLGIDAGTEKSYLNLDGASFEVADDSGVSNLRWLASDDELWVTVIVKLETEISDGYLGRCYETSLMALSKYILEDYEQNNDKTERDDLPEQQTA